eukprot:3249814-Rhodomonas_salina.1
MHGFTASLIAHFTFPLNPAFVPCPAQIPVRQTLQPALCERLSYEIAVPRLSASRRPLYRSNLKTITDAACSTVSHSASSTANQKRAASWMRGLVVREQREDEVESLRAQRSRFPNRKEPVTDPRVCILGGRNGCFQICTSSQLHKNSLIAGCLLHHPLPPHFIASFSILAKDPGITSTRNSGCKDTDCSCGGQACERMQVASVDLNVRLHLRHYGDRFGVQHRETWGC